MPIGALRGIYASAASGIAVNLMSCDPTPDEIYIHDGISSTVLTTIASPDIGIRDISNDGTNMFVAGASNSRIYIMSGFTSSVSSSFSVVASINGLTYDGTNMIHADSDGLVEEIYVHAGQTSTITATFSTPGADCAGLAFDGTNLLSSDSVLEKLYKHTGVTASITTSIAAPSTVTAGVAWDGSNLISASNGSNKMFLHSGFTTTITDSFASPSTSPAGLSTQVI